MTEKPSPVHVHFHRRLKMWSILRKRRLIGHAPSLVLAGCVMRTSEAARVRCQLANRREVHALIEGTLTDGARPADAVRIGYRPAEPGFRRRDTGAVVTAASRVWFEPDGTAWAANPTPSMETMS
ncbi:hypothetical protein [Methylobacterium platani]|uniref:Uncharacterized protein n=2 Tax=Methylobacterium platani TaxID=427683 RepID=A0A179S8C4_9HYPH|nr:hypothetical protein [Methylobacterium platani]KMO22329.1 hypothetical protein SQ03_01005 [Methylobacterium platani JCM 14648]OAS22529.1 hypothetical protein A5481_19235 [Methylobacterium platani]